MVKITKYELKQKIILYQSLAFIFFIGFIFINLLFYNTFKEVFIEDINFKIDFYKNYDGLNDKEINITNEWIEDVKPLYLQFVKNITFTKNKKLLNNLTNDTNILGLNINNGENIYVLITGNYKKDKFVLQHEIMHSIIRKIDEKIEESIIRDMDNKCIIFESCDGN